MMSCREASRLIAQDGLNASRFERLEVRLHLLVCRLCRRYRAQLQAIGTACREAFETGDEDPATVERLQRSILERRRP